ncbi:semaphorin-6C-like isoform X2 [Nelusetta ayraudi]|uniref:semaphorin-6C-like isoform X2 n=1 Tax=Nelusetta ayraudi TaxID=303726 RepID=UPI003F717E19
MTSSDTPPVLPPPFTMATPDWLPPWQLLLLSVLTSCFLSASAETTPFPRDLEPISIVGLNESQRLPVFGGLLQDNDTQRLGLNFQKFLKINQLLYIAARDHVFLVNLTLETFSPQLKLTWRSQDVAKCQVRGKNSDECYNYIKVLVPRDDETLFACGTNAFNPTCRNYKMVSLQQVGEELVGQARCPFQSAQSNVALFSGGDFYSATMTDFLASDAVIYRSLGGEGRPVLRTVKYDSKWLREPHFLHAIDYGNYVYFFLSEISVEYTALGKVVFSRVARVCKNDNGGSPRVLERHWTSFLKARLNCSLPGDSFFYFDVLQSLTNVLQVEGEPAVVAVFTTQANSIPGSAVCVFFMVEVEQVFSGRFKEQRSSDLSWTPVAEEQVPRPRPGSCAGDGAALDFQSSVQFPDETLTFIKTSPLMDQAVPPAGGWPCFTRTASRSRLTQVVVDVSAGPSRDRTVLFLGSEDGHLLKVLVGSVTNHSRSSRLLEDLLVYDPARCDVRGQQDRRVVSLELDKEHHHVFVAFSSCIIRVPLSRCSQHGACRRSCLASRDPYCIWLRTGSCASLAPGFKAGFDQDLDGDHAPFSLGPSHPDGCRAGVLATSHHQGPAPDGGGGLLEHQQSSSSSQVHYTLLVASVLLAFLLGAALSALLVSCYCGHQGAALGMGAGPEAALPRPLSLRSLARLNGLLLLDTSAQHKEEQVGVASPPSIYSSFLSSGLLSPAHQGVLPPDTEHSQSPADGELSGLPTPSPSPSSSPSPSPSLSPSPTPDLSIKDLRGAGLRPQQRQRNHNCNNAAAEAAVAPPTPTEAPPPPAAAAPPPATFSPPSPGPPLSFVAVVGAGPSPSGLLANGVACGTGGGGGGISPRPRPLQPSLPQPVDVSALDELLQHIQEVAASGSAGIKVLTSCSCGPGPSPHCGHVPCSSSTDSAPFCRGRSQPQTRPHRYNSQQKQQTPTSSFLTPPTALSSAPTSRMPGGGGAPVSRHHSQRHQLVRVGGALPRHHSFHQRGAPPPALPLLARMNSNSSSNGPPPPGGAAPPPQPGGAAAPTCCLTRQHSYSGGPHHHQRAPPRPLLLRRTLSLKPQVPPKPLFLPNAAVVEEGGGRGLCIDRLPESQ